MNCPSCHRPNAENSRFCIYCGAGLSVSAAGVPWTAPVAAPAASMMTGGQWIRARFVPVVLIAAVAGVLLGLARSSANCSFFGIQGMLVGGLLGFAAGRMGRGDPGLFWSMGQRLWLAAGTALAFTVPHLVATSVGHAGPIDPPLYWLQEVADGFMKEPFFSIGSNKAYAGQVEGGWWVFFTILDAMLFAFLFLGIGAAGLSGSPQPDPAPSARTRSACAGTLALTALFAAAGAGYALLPRQGEVSPYSTENIARIRPLAGEWKMDSGRGVFEDSDEELRFTLKLAGFNMLAGESAGQGRYVMHIENQGDDFRGRLHSSRNAGLAGLPTSFRMRPSAEGSRLTMVFTVFGMQGRRDVTINAAKVRAATPEEESPVPRRR